MTATLRRAAVCAAMLLLSAPLQFAQTNQGTDFYLGFMQNLGSPNLVLFITGNTATTGTVTIPGLAFTTPFTVTPGAITAVNLPASAATSGSDAIQNRGVHVVSGAPVTVYGLNQVSFTTDAYLGLPATLLGTDHIVLGYRGGLGGPSEFEIVSSQDNNVVTITPSAATAGGHAAGIPYTITLNTLQAYQVQANDGTSGVLDLSGTLISSTKPLALFAGALCTNIPTTSSVACDHVVEQIPATGAWGQNFLTVPLATRTGGDTFRVIARDNGTVVQINGSTVATLNRAQIFQTVLGSSTQNLITTSGPALVAQYSNSTTFDNVTSDPFEMLIQPTEQFQTSYTVTTPAASPVAFTNFVNVVAKTSETATCRVDGAAIAGFSPIGASGYSGSKVPVSIGTHNLNCPSGFGTYIYGFASFDSYGYPGGLGLKFISTPRCDVNGDKVIDLLDINLILAARNVPASGPEDPRDADGDLTITVADARACQQKCTNAGCK